MTPQELDQKIREGLLQDRESASAKSEEIGKEILGVRLQLLAERRELVKHISLISAAVLGLVATISDKALITYYLLIGTGLHATVIALSFSLIRGLTYYFQKRMIH